MRLTSKGQVTIPKSVREKLGVKPGDEIGFREEGQQMIVYGDTSPVNGGENLSVAERLADWGAQMRTEGKMKPLGMTVDEYMEMMRGYGEDGNDPGFQHYS